MKSQETGTNEGLAWYEKDLSDFEFEENEIYDDEETVEEGTYARLCL